MFVDNLFRDLFCLYENSGCKNYLETCSSLDFSYCVENVFFRSVDGEGQVIKDSKFSFILKGNGPLSIISSDRLRFWTSKISRKNKAVKCVKSVGIEKDFYTNEKYVRLNDEFYFPVFDVLLVSKKVNQNQWILELKEI